jgi:hypothetical protein
MPRKKSDEKLTKVISSVVSLEDFNLLEKYARLYYEGRLLKLPTISHLVRFILKNWAKSTRTMEEKNLKLTSPIDHITSGLPSLINKTQTI